MMSYALGGGYSTMMGGAGIFASVTWLLVVVFLVLGSVYFWKGINKKK